MKIIVTILLVLMALTGMSQSRKKTEPSHITMWSANIITVNDSLKGQVGYRDHNHWVIQDTPATLNVLLQTNIRLHAIGERLIKINRELLNKDDLKKLLAIQKSLDKLKIPKY